MLSATINITMAQRVVNRDSGSCRINDIAAAADDESVNHNLSCLLVIDVAVVSDIYLVLLPFLFLEFSMQRPTVWTPTTKTSVHASFYHNFLANIACLHTYYDSKYRLQCLFLRLSFHGVIDCWACTSLKVVELPLSLRRPYKGLQWWRRQAQLPVNSLLDPNHESEMLKMKPSLPQPEVQRGQYHPQKPQPLSHNQGFPPTQFFDVSSWLVLCQFCKCFLPTNQTSSGSEGESVPSWKDVR